MSEKLFEAVKEFDTKEFLIAVLDGNIVKPEHKDKVNRMLELMKLPPKYTPEST